MRTKHTPGPWQAIFDPISKRSRVESDAWPNTIAWTISGGEDLRYANARLIAAAPDLLEALESLLLWAEDTRRQRIAERDWASSGQIPPQVTRARAAIAKAKGEA